jgi:flavin-dependent dehydrogenase
MKYKILGGGPSGLSTAVKLLLAGYDVEVTEQTATVGGFLGTDIQAIRNYGEDSSTLERLKKEGLEIKKYNEIFKIVKYSPTHRKDVIYSKKEPIFYTILRGVKKDSIENQLANQIYDLGGEIKLGKKGKVINSHIVAFGSKFDPVGMIYGGVFENSDFDKKTIFQFLGNKYTEGGYAYVAPYNKKLVTVAITSFFKSNFNTLGKRFDEFVEKDKVVSKLLENASLVHRYGGYGHFNIPSSAMHKHKYFVGGAAGFVDPARGFGLKYAMLSGVLAAKAITESKDYDKLWKEEFEKELMAGFSRYLAFKQLKNADYEKMISGKKIHVKDYAKLKNQLKELLLGINAKLKHSHWKKSFNFEDLMGL